MPEALELAQEKVQAIDLHNLSSILVGIENLGICTLLSDVKQVLIGRMYEESKKVVNKRAWSSQKFPSPK